MRTSAPITHFLFDRSITTLNKSTLWLSLFFISMLSLSQSSLYAQVTNDDRINFDSKLYRVRWNAEEELGDEEPTWRFRYGLTSQSSGYNSFSNYSGWPCITATNKSYAYPNRRFNSGTYYATSTRQHWSMFAFEDDRGSRCTFDTNGGFFDDDDDLWHASYDSYLVKNGNQGSWTYHNFTGYQNRSNGQFRSAWRYYYGDNLNTPLTFGTISNGTTKTHINSNANEPADATSSVGYNNSYASSAGNDVVYSFSLSEAGQVTISTAFTETNYDTYLYLLDNNGNYITADDQSGGSNTSLISNYKLCAGTYKIVVDGWISSSVGNFKLSVGAAAYNVSPGSIAIAGSTSYSLCQGYALPNISSVTSASNGKGTLAYKWDKWNGSSWVEISGATGVSYTPPGVMGTSYLYYQRRAIDQCGKTGTTAYVTIAPILRSIAGGTIAASGSQYFQLGTDPGSIVSTIDASGTPNPYIRWYQRVWNGSGYGGWSQINGQTGQTLDVPAITQRTLYARYIYNECGQAASANTLEFFPLPADGEIYGTVKVGNSTIGVDGVNVVARRVGAIPGGAADVTYSATTTVDGSYTISDIYYGPNGADYEVIPTLGEYTFEPADTTITINAAASDTLDFKYVFQGGNILFVDQSYGGGYSGSDLEGTSWNYPFTNIQDALDVANGNEGTFSIYIAKGTYYPTKKRCPTCSERQKTFYINDDVKIYGGFAGSEIGPDQRINIEANATVLSGDLDQNDTHINGIVESVEDINNAEGSTQQNAFHVVYIDTVSSETLFDGLIITAGFADSTGIDSRGGGVYNNAGTTGQSSSPQFKNVLIVGNAANSWGGGIYNNAQNGGTISSTFEHVEFRGNEAYNYGGAIFNWGYGGTINTDLYDVHFVENYATYSGGGIFNYGNSITSLDHATFLNNEASGAGAAIANWSGGATIDIYNSSFLDNGPISIENSFANLSLTNSIVWGETITSFRLQGSPAPFVQNSIVKGSYGNGINIYDEDPFFDPSTTQNNTGSSIGGYLKLLECSNAIDRGNNDLVTDGIEEDLDGNDRFQDGKPGGRPGQSPDETEETVDLGPYEVADPFSLTASEGASDSWIQLDWYLNANHCECLAEDPSQQQGVFVELKQDDGTLLMSWQLYPENFVDLPYSGTYKHRIGPGLTQSYRLEINRVGPGTTNCHQNATGSTSDFLTPIVSATEDLSPDSTIITWQSRSWLGDIYNIYRDSSFIGSVEGEDVPGGTFEFVDVYRMYDSTSMVNGQIYDYRIETVSTQIGEELFVVEDIGEDVGNSLPIALIASDDDPVHQVELDWQLMSTYCDQMRITREGEVIAVLSKGAVEFDDTDPYYGEAILYGVELMKDGVPYVGSYNHGSAPPNGIISGRVLTQANNYPVVDVTITLSYVSSGDTLEMSTTSDFTGSFSFEGLFYDRMNSFELTASSSSTEPFLENPISVHLDLENPVVDDVVFYETDGYEAGMVFDKLLTFSATPVPSEDRMQIDWTYIPTVDTITYFNLYRGTSLIAQINDSTSTDFSFVDLTGIPEEEYEYKLTAYQIEDGITMDTTVFLTETFPTVAPVVMLDVALADPNIGVLDIDWAHTSTNFSGFRLYRNGFRILDTDHTDFDYTDLDGRPDSMEYYYITAYRTLDDVDYESIPADTIFQLYPGLPAVTVINANAQPLKDLVELSWTVPAALIPDYNYSGFNLYRMIPGVDTTLLRTIDASFAQAGESIEVDDRTGVPDTDYTYEVRTFLKSSTVDAEKMGAQIVETFPSVSVPQNLVSTSSLGKIALSWSSPHTSTNYEGFAIYKTDAFDELGEIGVQYNNQFIDYTNNPDQDTMEYYGVATYRIVDDIRYYSDTISVNSDPPTGGPDPLFFSSFIASRDQANHIKVCWTWESDAAQPFYVISREGVAIDTLPHTSRAYYDYGAPEGVDVEYSIYAYYIDPITTDSNGDESFTTQSLYSSGLIPSMKTIAGRVYKRNSGKGISGVEIIARSTENVLYQNKTKTDAAGYYQFTDISNGGYNFSSSDEPQIIANTTISTIEVFDDFIIEDLNVETLMGSHTWLSDMDIRLIAPNGTFAYLLRDKCGNQNSPFKISFDDESLLPYNSIPCPFNNDAVYQPEQTLSVFDGHSAKGIWTLEIIDDFAPADDGLLNGWMLLFNDYDVKSTFEMVLTADSINSSYIANPQAIILGRDGVQDYTVNFIDTFETAATDMEVAEVLALTATPQPAEISVLLNWSPSNENYSGFEIYRGQELIGEVLSGNPPMWEDNEGVNGVFTLYFVRAFILTAEGKEFSDFANVGVDYPILEPVQNLTVTPYDDKNQVVIQWGHPYDNHDFYLVERNGVAISAVNTGDQMIVIDTIGSPGELYIYTVTAWKGATQSIEVSEELRYPSVFYLNTLEVSSPVDVANENNSMNHLLLEWDYTVGAADSFLIIRYTKDNFGNKQNEEVIARASGEDRSYQDYTGEPGLIYFYEVLGLLVRNGQEYYSIRRDVYSDSDTYPVIAFANTRLAQGNLPKGWLELSFDYLYPTVDSFVVTRVGTAEPIEIIKDVNFEAGQAKVVIDQSGIPEQPYTYKVQVFSRRNGKIFSSVNKTFTPSPVAFPKVPMPTMAVASDGEFNNKINFSWEYDEEIAIDGFRLKRKFSDESSPSQLDEGGILTAGRRMFSDGDPILQELDANDLVDYYVEAFRTVPSVGTFYSDPAADDGYIFSGRYAPTTNNSYHRLGQDVALGRNGIQDWAIVGTTEGVAYIYKKILDGSWVLYQELKPSISSYSYGRAVSISGKYAVVGAPYESSSRGAAYIYTYNSTTKLWEEMDIVTHPTRNYYDYFGYSVDILDESQDYLIVGAYGDDNNNSSASGSALIFKRDGVNWTNDPINGTGTAPAIVNASEYQNSANFGRSVAIGRTSDNKYYAVVGAPNFDYSGASVGTGTNVGQSYIFNLSNSSNNSWIETNKINPSYREWCCNQFGISVDISKDLIIIGERAYESSSFKGAASIFSYSSPNWSTTPTEISASPSEGYGYFGTDVSIVSGVNNNYALVSENPNSHNETVYLFKQSGSSWIQQSPVYTQDLGTNDNFGQSVAISEYDALIGAPNDDNERGTDAGSIHFYPIGTLPAAPTFVNATDNAFPSKITITWEHTGSGVQQFQILRDGVLIGAVAANDAYFFDDNIDENDLTPGKKHFYEVVAKSSGGQLSPPGSDFGSVLANGVIQGKVTATDGVSPVENVELFASVIVDGERYEYGPVISAGDGTYEFTQLYYGEEADFEVYPILEGHEFDPMMDSVNLAKNGAIDPPTAIEINFKDITAYSVSGIVRHQNIPECGLEGVVLEYRSVLKNGTVIINKGLSEPITTDANGFYSFVIDPFITNLDSIVIAIKDTMLVGMAPEQDTIIFDFATQSGAEGLNTTGLPYFTDFDNIPQFSMIDFYDQTTYEVNLAIKNTCDETLNDDHFSVRAFTRDGCYQQEILLNSAGEGTMTLPPLDLIIVVSDIDNKTGENLVFLESLMNSPVSLDLYGIHRDTARYMDETELEEYLFTQFTYHLPPRVMADFSMLDEECSGNGIVTQGEQYSIPVTAIEEFDSGDCAVTEGYLKITNGASINTASDTIYYDDMLGGFPDYEFVAGDPNVVAPHVWNLSIEYFSKADQFLGRVSQPLFVEGEVGIPGNGIMVDAGNGGGTQDVPLPLYVLRDPPGDASFSTIAQGQSVTKSVSWSGDIGGAVSLSSETSFKVAGVGASVNLETSIGGSVGGGTNLEITTTTSKEISTSDSEDAIGVDGDVIVGAGLAMQYGLKSVYTYEGCGVEGMTIKETRKVGLTPNSISTTWVYSTQFVQKLVDDFQSDIPLLASGAKVLEENGEPISASNAVKRYTAYRDNWQQILEYHKRETNPYYYLCTTDFSKPTNRLRLDQIIVGGIANQWRDALLSVLDLDGDNKPDLDITFNDSRLTAYNNAAYAIRGLLDENIPIVERLILYNFTSSRFSSESYAPAGEMAKNITFEGNAGAYTETFGQSRSFTNSFTSTFFSESSIGGGLSLDLEGNIFIGFGGGTIIKLTDFETEINASVTATANISNESATTQAAEDFVSYTLDDDDPGDEISVTVLKSIDVTQTPFFQLLGGETSCPAEVGSINRDDPIIQILDPDSGLPGLSANLYFQPANAPAEFMIRVVNNSPTGDVRGYEIFLDNASNPDNAELNLSGQSLKVIEFPDEDPYAPQDLTLSVTRGSAFDYEGLRVGIRPLGCGGTDAKYVTMNVSFVTPCSPVTIVQPNDNWLMNSSNKELVIAIRDYQPDVDILEDFELQYRRLDSDPTWKQLPYPYLVDENNPVDKETLADWNFTYFGPGQIPTYYFAWQLPDDRTKFPDGDYEVRVVATCKEGSLTTKTFSNVVSGSINRTRLQLFGVPQPSDGAWTSGDLISAEFNKNVDCTLFDDPDYVEKYLKVEVDGVVIPEANFTCLNNEIRVTLPDMTLYDGKRMYVTLDSIVDPTGNLAINVAGTSRTIEWDFLVVTGQAYWEQDSVIVELYEGETTVVPTGLKNVELAVPLNNIQILRSTASQDWLSTDPNFDTNFSINPGSIRPVDLTINGTTEGIYTDTITVAGLSGSTTIPRLPVKVIVNKRPPYPPDWEDVNSGLYPSSMTVVANFKYEGDADYSRDTLDQISVFIGNSQRGIGRIQDAGNGYHVAYLTIYGSAADEGKPLEFRVWDSKDDLEYDGHPDPDTLKFEESAFKGKTSDPIILNIDVAKDLARYIPLNQGWTWFSFNSVEDSMGTNYLLRGLKDPEIGDRILSQNSFAEYVNDTIGWYAPKVAGIDTLDELNTEDSYMIYLANQADSIRITGVDATPVNGRVLFQGWNWVGYPLQESQAIDEGFTVINIQPNDQIRSKDSSALWLANSSWDGPMNALVPNEGYKIQINTGGAVLNYNEPTMSFYDGHTDQYELNKYADNQNKSGGAPDTADASTWMLNLDEIAFQDVVPVVGEVELNGVLETTGTVAAFLGTEIRGVGHITIDPVFNKALFTLFIGINSASDLDGLELYFATEDGTEFFAANVSAKAQEKGLALVNLVEDPTNTHGVYNFNSPLRIIIGGGSDCAQSVLAMDDSDIATATYRAIDTLHSAGIIKDQSEVVFVAGKSIVLNENFEVELGALFEAVIGDCPTAQPLNEDEIRRVEKSRILHEGGDDARTEVELIFNRELSTDKKIFIDYLFDKDNPVIMHLTNAKGDLIKRLVYEKKKKAGQYRHAFSTKGIAPGRYKVNLIFGSKEVYVTVDIK